MSDWNDRPSGLSVSSTEFVQTFIGDSVVYNSGESKAIKIFLNPNDTGEFVMRCEVIYFGNDEKNFKLPISERIVVVGNEEVKRQTTISEEKLWLRA